MAVERKDPLPPGRYWVFLYPAEIDTWQAWVRRNAPNVAVRASERQTVTPDNPLWGMTPSGDIIEDAAGEVVLFDVIAPVAWIGFGFPTIVKSVGMSPSDIQQALLETATAPDPEEGIIAQGFRTLQGALLIGGALYLAVMLLHSDSFTKTRRASAHG